VIILGMVAYYLFAIALIAAVVLLAVRQNKRAMDAAYARWEQDRRKWRETTPPLPLRQPPVDFDDTPDEEEEDVPDLNAPALQPIAPLLRRAAREYLAKPHDRERLLRSLREALGATSPSP
jgi:hypothetical protein